MSNPRAEQEVFDDLSVLCTSPGYAHAIAYLCYRDHVVGYADFLKGSEYAKLFSFDRLIRTEVSTLIGLMVRGQRDLELPDAETLQGYIFKTEELLKELHEALNQPIIEGLKKAFAHPERRDDFNPFTSAAALREPIFYGAESAYSFQYRELSVEKYERDKEWLLKVKGFTPQEAQSFTKTLCSFLNNNMFNTLKGLKDLPPEQWSLLDGFKFKVSDISDNSDLSIDTIEAILEAFLFPDDGNTTFTSLHEFNSVNAFPLIKADDTNYILFLYVSLTEALYDTPFYWMGSDKTYTDTAMTNRGAFTEEFTAKRLEHVFGGEKVLRNIDIWETKSKKKKLGEIDVLVLYGDRALVIQAKSKKLTLAARKGNDLQLQKDFKGAVQDACDQATFCCKLMIEGRSFLAHSSGEEVVFKHKIKKTYPVCVVSDHYPALSFQAHQFMSCKVTREIDRPLVCDVFFIDVVTEFLETPLTFLSYIELRAKAANNINLSHEIVALAYHLHQNLWLGEYDYLALSDDISADLDIAMAVRRDGVDGAADPNSVFRQLKNTAVGKIISHIEGIAEPGAIATGMELLKLSGESSNNLSRMIDRIVAQAERDGEPHDATIATDQGGSGITVHCNSLPDFIAIPKLRTHCEKRKYVMRASNWFGLLLKPNNGDVRFGLALDYKWKQDVVMDAIVENMPRLQSARNVEAILSGKGQPKIGRNEPCPCGSGVKYKKCHLPRGGFS